MKDKTLKEEDNSSLTILLR